MLRQNHVPDAIRDYQYRQAVLRHKRRQARLARRIGALALLAASVAALVNVVPARVETYRSAYDFSPAPSLRTSVAGYPAPAPGLPGKTTALDATTYADKYVGRLTADGTRYSHDSDTVASNRHPLGAKVSIAWAGRTVRGTVRDRLSRRFSHRIDLSRGLWRRLTGGAKPGLARGARVEVTE